MAKHSYQESCNCKRCLKERNRRATFKQEQSNKRMAQPKQTKSSWEKYYQNHEIDFDYSMNPQKTPEKAAVNYQTLERKSLSQQSIEKQQ